MYNKVLKNHEVVNLRTPFEIRTPIGCQTIKKLQNLSCITKEINNEQVRIDLMVKEKEILDKARSEADLIRKEAELEVSELLEQTEHECFELKKSTEEKAWEQGYQEGSNQALKQYGKLIEDAERLKQQTRAEFAEAMAALEDDAVQLVLDIARKVIGSELSQQPDSILHIIRQALEKCTISNDVILKVAEEDYSFVCENREKLQAYVQGSVDIEIRMDQSLTPGSCILETPFGCIDAGIDTKLDRLEEIFREQMGNRMCKD